MILLRVMVFLSFCVVAPLYSQTDPYIRVNRIWGGVASNGGNKGITYGSSNLNLFADYDAYGARFQGNESYFGAFTIIGTNNWNGKTAVFSPLATDQAQGNIVTPLVNYARYASPNYTITSQGLTGTPQKNDLGSVVIDPSKCIGTSDQSVIVTNGYVTPNLQIQKKVLAWTQQFHDNYAIVDLTITNKGSTTLTGVYIAMSDGEYQLSRADGNNPSIAAVDNFANTRKWYHYYGADKSDTLRVYYDYTSDDPETAGDRIGQPLTQQGGRLVDYDFTFMACLHASKQPYTPTPSFSGAIDPNDQDDMNQPMVTTVANKQNNLNLALLNQTFNPTGTDAAAYYSFISGAMLQSEDITSSTVRPGHHRKNLDELGKNAPGGENGIGALSNTFESMLMSFGPYTFGPGQQIRIVKATGIAGINREKAIEVGRKWLVDTKNGTNTLDDPKPNSPTGSFPSNFVFPQNATTTDIKKDKWVSTGIDSVLLTVSRAKYNFLTGYKVPSTPPPPSYVSIAGSSEGIVLRWSDAAAEVLPNFTGYRIMKKIGIMDTTYYQEIYRSNATDKDTVHSYVDKSVRVGATHYYYIQSMAAISSTDLNAHSSERGKTIYSGRVYFYNNIAVTGEAPLGDQLEKIAIVPNPFNWNDPLLRGYGYTNPSNLQISFYELPRTVTIQIYTEAGDLVKTINHNQNSGFNKWNMTNEAGQTVASGIYVVLFTTPEGGVSYQKLVIVR
jgi:hypothetical protein